MVRRVGIAVLPLLCVAITPQLAEAHPGGVAYGPSVWTAWNFDPLVLLNLTALSCLYLVGTVRLWRRAGTGRGVAGWRVAAFAGSIGMLFIALVSPLDVFSDELSWVHMVQHMVLVTVAAPLFVLGAPGVVLLWAMPSTWRRAVRRWPQQFAAYRVLWRAAWNPLIVWVLHAAALWIWHAPPLYQAALGNLWIHDLQHLSFFVTAWLFWRVLLDPLSRFCLNPGVGVLYLFSTSLQATALGVLMALSPYVWYSDYVGRTEPWGLTPLEDQQLAGLIMWMPACTAYALAAAAIFGVWLARLDRATMRVGT